MRPHGRAPRNLFRRLTPLQFRATIALASMGVLAWDFFTLLPIAALYWVIVGATFWSTDRWMPLAAGVTGAACIMVGLASPIGPTSYPLALAIRASGALSFIGSGWLITRYRALLEEGHERETLLRTIFDSEPACVKVLSPGGVLLDMNRAGLDMVEAADLQSVLGSTVLPLITQEHRDAFTAMSARVIAGESTNLQYEIVGLRGTRLWLDSRAAPLRDAAGNVTALLCVTQDITEQKRAQALLQDSERRLTQAAALAELGFFEHNHQTDEIYWSPGALRIVGTSPEEQWNHSRAIAISHPDDLESTAATVARAHDPAGDGLMNLSGRIVRPDGEVRHVHVRSQTQFADLGHGRVPTRTMGTMWDVTARNHTEMQRDALALRVLEAHEDERRAIARDLHDEIGQALAALKLNLLRLRREAAGGGRIVTDSLRIADEVLQQVRDLALSLRPSMLDDLGLGVAVQWYAEQTAGRAGLTLSCEVEATAAGISPTTEIACFRVLQEALTNIVRHAAATNISVQLRTTGSHMDLVVRDDGRGFDVDSVLANADRGTSMGLLGIRERSALLGGVTTITSAPGVGSEIRAHLPILANDCASAEAIA